MCRFVSCVGVFTRFPMGVVSGNLLSDIYVGMLHLSVFELGD